MECMVPVCHQCFDFLITCHFHCDCFPYLFIYLKNDMLIGYSSLLHRQGSSSLTTLQNMKFSVVKLFSKMFLQTAHQRHVGSCHKITVSLTETSRYSFKLLRCGSYQLLMKLVNWMHTEFVWCLITVCCVCSDAKPLFQQPDSKFCSLYFSDLIDVQLCLQIALMNCCFSNLVSIVISCSCYILGRWWHAFYLHSLNFLKSVISSYVTVLPNQPG